MISFFHSCPRRILPPLLVAGLLAAVCGNAGATGPAARCASPAAGGGPAATGRLSVQSKPFKLALHADDGRELVSTLTGRPGLPPLPNLAAQGPSPLTGAGELGAYVPFGWIAGAALRRTFPASFFQGNRLFGAEAGTVVAATAVVDRSETDAGTVYKLATDLPLLPPATLTVTRLQSGAYRLDLRPPPGLQPAATLFALRSPAGEGLYGLGARKDAFNQRGLLRNVWTEQQNTGAGPFAPVSDPLLGETYSFPNGAQAAYYVQAALFGSRGWGAWVAQSQLSRLDLAATRPGVLRWSVAAPRG